MVDCPESALDRIRSDSQTKWSGGRFRNLQESTKEKDKDSAFYRDYYGRELWREKLADSVIEQVNKRLDRNLAEKFGYRVLND